MILGHDKVGRRGIGVLLAAALVAVVLGIRGFNTGGLGVAVGNLSGARSTTVKATASPAATPQPAATKAPGKKPGASNSGNHGSTSPTPTATSSTVKLGPPLSSTQYASAAYQIYPGPINSTARAALAGFSASFKRTAAGVLMTFSSPGSGQPPTHHTYAASDKIYFIEESFGDDSGNSEFNFGDDGLIVTNAQGRIIQG